MKQIYQEVDIKLLTFGEEDVVRTSGGDEKVEEDFFS